MLDFWEVCDPDYLVLVTRICCGSVLLGGLVTYIAVHILLGRRDPKPLAISDNIPNPTFVKPSRTRKSSYRKNPPLQEHDVSISQSVSEPESDVYDETEPAPKFSEWRIAARNKAGYKSLDQMRTLKDEIPAAACNLKLNRHLDVLPNPRTRVTVTRSSNDKTDGYINANFIRSHANNPKHYICAQGPLETTVDVFWKMVFEQQVVSIVMVTGLVEKGSTKCIRYWPAVGNSMPFGKIVVTATSMDERQGFTITKLKLTYPSFGTHQVTHFWCDSWPDHGIPKDLNGNEFPDNILTMRSHVNNHQARLSSTAPILSHCSAGVGRSGCYIALDYALNAVEDQGTVDVLEVIRTIRNDRVALVQHYSQYSFILTCIKKFAEDHGISVIKKKAVETPVEDEEVFDGFSPVEEQAVYMDMGGGNGVPPPSENPDTSPPSRPQKRRSTRQKLASELSQMQETKSVQIAAKPIQRHYQNVDSPDDEVPAGFNDVEEETFGF